MRIALLGYGKMGKAIEEIAQERGHSISARISKENLSDWEEVNTSNTDVVIEFSVPHSVMGNIDKCLDKDLPVVVGTTGWYDHIDTVKQKVLDRNQSFLYASNFSLGVNLFFKLNEALARMMHKYEQYIPSITEIHHIHKVDAPSGTAISLANGLLANYPRLKEWELDSNDPSKLSITAIREDEVPGTHSIEYASDTDEIEIKHVAKSRKGFALGSILAAEWIEGKKGFFTMDDVLDVKIS